jgi:hypothetical protein
VHGGDGANKFKFEMFPMPEISAYVVGYVGTSTGFIERGKERRRRERRAYSSKPLSNLDSVSCLLISSSALMLNIFKNYIRSSKAPLLVILHTKLNPSFISKILKGM